MKRFLSYEIVKRLSMQNDMETLFILHKHVNKTDSTNGQKHDVFIRSFDAKPIYYRKFAEQKINYMHENPVKGKWQLSDSYINYPWSSAKFYECNDLKFTFLTQYTDLT
ncbi:MAG: hypothetical protein K0R51_459 [Cytophagaceae bacterium]|nr:hypothetical protein [Cytophagaceae bacterium]